jgi:hypothetical protein
MKASEKEALIEAAYQFVLKSGVTLDSHPDDLDCLESDFFDEFGMEETWTIVHDDWFQTHAFDHKGKPCRLLLSDIRA